jgi:hypothetical protein
VEYWTKTGLTCGGVLNKLTTAVVVDHANPDELKAALALGPLMCGAMLGQANVDSDFMWQPADPSIGGHEFLVVGYETLPSGTWYDIVTWDGERRCTDEFMAQCVDEAAMVLDPAFFDANGIDPAGIDMAAVRTAMAGIAA